MCAKAIEEDPLSLHFIANYLKAQEVVNSRGYFWEFVQDYLKSHKMSIKEVKEDPWVLEFVPDLFLMQNLAHIWHDDKDYYDDNGHAEWYNGHKKYKALKKKKQIDR